MVAAALEVVDAQGFEALSLRAVARQLEVAPMTLYTYLADSAELERLVIERVIAAQVAGITWPDDWRECLLAFAEGLSAVVERHPAMLEAYAHGAVRTPSALQAAETVLSRLRDGAGLSRDEALVVYEAVHGLVLGHALLRRAASQPAGPDLAGLASDLPHVREMLAAGARLGGSQLRAGVELLLAGLPVR